MKLPFRFKKTKEEKLRDKEFREQLNRIMKIASTPKDKLPLYAHTQSRDVLKKRFRVINGGKSN
ncbi:hypothetical protein L2D08_06950 [Domibacillus sp. PGB-M46]|uniref:hypothetical protein n=1 Tax=Domibacillus sp. PGB-M46 TaxID=2910255 RepID=UPI001F59BF4C|nr:hypothetical protein [Domibacillus sp. PGB-M46]MCI2254099.1 hypothetical protein [Domibacillus sp. PGB-M46]